MTGQCHLIRQERVPRSDDVLQSSRATQMRGPFCLWPICYLELY